MYNKKLFSVIAVILLVLMPQKALAQVNRFSSSSHLSSALSDVETSTSAKPTEAQKKRDTPTSTGGNKFSLAAILIKAPDDNYSCNGVTLNKTWVLTAAHCFKEQLDNSAFTVVTDARSGVEEIVRIKGADLALIKLTGDLPKVGCTILPKESPVVKERAKVYVFRGMNGDVEEIPLTVEETNHIADNPTIKLGAHPMIALAPDQQNGVLTREGDSGSAVFLSNDGATAKLSGIVSGTSSKKKVSLAEDIAKYADEIEDTVGACPI